MRASLRLSIFALAWAFGATAVQAQRAPGWIGIGFEIWEGDQGQSSVVVTEVREGSPAATAGVQIGDRLLTINDASSVTEFENLAERLALRVGDRVDITLVRDGRRLAIDLRAAERPAGFAAVTPKPPLPADSMVESMFRAMDSLRVQILAASGVRVAPAPRRPEEPAFIARAAAEPRPVSAPFEFFVFRGERHDSLRQEMEALNRRVASLRDLSAQLERRRAAIGISRAEVRQLDAQLVELDQSIEAVTRESSDLRDAMAEAARVSAGFQYRLDERPGAPFPAPVVEEPPFRPLTPYLLGSNRVAGAELVELRRGLADYFGVDVGVLVVDVAPGTPMAIAGIEAGDVIVYLDHEPVRTVDEVRVGIAGARETLPLTLVRRGSSLEVLLRRR